MSLLDDVSIVVTPNGYKAGTLYGVLPTATESSELITCGDFACADPNAAWTRGTGTTISSGVANITAASSGSSALSQTGGIFVSGKRFKVTFTISNYSSGSIAVSNISPTTYRSANGTYTLDAIGAGGDFLFFSSGFVGSVDNISVIEVTNSDMDVTRATAATRVDENGLVNYAEIVGDELVTCGDFSCATPSTYWTATNAVVSFSNNQITVDDTASAGGDSRATQNFPTISGRVYRVKINRISTTTTFWLSIGNGFAFNNIKYLNLGTDTGEYTTEFTATGSSSTIALQAGGSGVSVFSDVTVKEVTRDNVPRIDYTGGGCPHILSEPMRTNLITYSEDFSQWSKEATVTLTPNYSTSPDGTNNATRVQLDADDSMWLSSLGSSKAFSIYVKGVAGETIRISNGVATMFTLTGNWDRLEVFDTLGSSTLITLNTYSSATARDIQIWGAQLEESYATSYIPTSGSTVTRNQDIFTRDGIGSLINSTEGVLFAEIAALPNDTSGRWLSLSNGTVNERLSFGFQSSNIRLYIKNTSGLIWDYTTSGIDILNDNKIALKYKSGDYALWINGTEVSTSTNSNLPSGLISLQFSAGVGGGSGNFFGKVKQLQVYNTALTDAQLTSLTS